MLFNEWYDKFIKYNEEPIRSGGMTGNQAHFANWLLSTTENRNKLRMIGDLETIFSKVQQFVKNNPEPKEEKLTT